MIYFDNSATTYPKPENVYKSVNNAMRYYSANPGRSGHNMSMKAAKAVYDCRKTVSEFFNLNDESKVIFTSSCTHSLNTVIKGVLRNGDHCVISCFEHNSVIRPLEKLKAKNVSYSIAQVFSDDSDKTVDSFRKAINEKTKLVVCTHASNVFGIRLPVERICALAHEYGVMFCLDAAQSAGVLDINIDENNYDFVCCPGHKGLYGPMGTGVLLINNDSLKETLLEGGTGSMSQSFLQPDFLPDRFESGTLNIPGICGLKKGIEFVKSVGVSKIHSREMSYIRTLRNSFENNRYIELYPKSVDYSYDAPLLSFIIQNSDSEAVAQYLNNYYSIAVRAGLHCSLISHQNMKTDKTGTVRISPSYFTTNHDVNVLIKAINNFKKSI